MTRLTQVVQCLVFTTLFFLSFCACGKNDGPHHSLTGLVPTKITTDPSGNLNPRLVRMRAWSSSYSGSTRTPNKLLWASWPMSRSSSPASASAAWNAGDGSNGTSFTSGGGPYWNGDFSMVAICTPGRMYAEGILDCSSVINSGIQPALWRVSAISCPSCNASRLSGMTWINARLSAYFLSSSNRVFRSSLSPRMSEPTPRIRRSLAASCTCSRMVTWACESSRSIPSASVATVSALVLASTARSRATPASLFAWMASPAASWADCFAVPASLCALSAIPSSKFLTAVSALAPNNSQKPSPLIPPITKKMASSAYAFCERINQTRGVRTRVRVLTSWVCSRSKGFTSSMIAPTSKMIVDHIRPQKYPSALLTSNALWVSSGEITTAPDYSDSNLPAWPAWIAVGLFALFCILRAINVFRKPDR
jgi:hypothetical protein